jgi:hypothetical protein
MSKDTNKLRIAKSTAIRETLVALRISGVPLKEASEIIGIGWKTGEWHWARIRRMLGNVSDMAIAAWAATTPRCEWALILMLALAGCDSHDVANDKAKAKGYPNGYGEPLQTNSTIMPPAALPLPLKQRTGRAIIPTAPVPIATFVWEYDPALIAANDGPIYFEVWKSTDLSKGFGGFSLWQNTPMNTFSVWGVTDELTPLYLGPQVFFIVRAVDAFTGKTSEWNK